MSEPKHYTQIIGKLIFKTQIDQMKTKPLVDKYRSALFGLGVHRRITLSLIVSKYCVHHLKITNGFHTWQNCGYLWINRKNCK